MLPIGDENLGRRRRPIVNYALIGACIAVFAVQGLAPVDSESLVRTWGLVPARLLHDGPFAAHTLITHMFLHGNFLHIGGNMLFLWVFGANIEDEFGHVPYLLFYLGTGVLAGLASVALRSTSDVPGIGASGAISGVLGAYLVLFPLSEIRVIILHPFTVLLWLGSLLYAPAAALSRGREGQARGLDALAHVERRDPGLAEALRWVVNFTV